MDTTDLSREELELLLFTARTKLEEICDYLDRQLRFGPARGDTRVALISHVQRLALEGLGNRPKRKGGA